MAPGFRVVGRSIVLAVFCCVLVGRGGPAVNASQERRDRKESRRRRSTCWLALIVGNDKYPKQPLANAVNDARSMQAVLQELGFSVTAVHDANYRDLRGTIERFADELKADDFALFYYAGHGVQDQHGANYLLPVTSTVKAKPTCRTSPIPPTSFTIGFRKRGCA